MKQHIESVLAELEQRSKLLREQIVETKALVDQAWVEYEQSKCKPSPGVDPYELKQHALAMEEQLQDLRSQGRELSEDEDSLRFDDEEFSR